MNILLNRFKALIIFCIVQALFLMPVYSLDLDTTVNDKSRKNYTREKSIQQKNTTLKQIDNSTQTEEKKNTENIPQTPVSTQVIQKTVLPAVPALPSKAGSSTTAPINTKYSGKCPDENAIIPCSDIKIGDLIIDETIVKSKPVIITSSKNKSSVSYNASKKATSKVNYRHVKLSKGTQIRAVNTSKITDYLYAGQKITFLTTQEIYTPYFKIPARTKLTAKVIDSHKPQMSCNGGLVAFRIISAEINGYTQPMNAGIIRINSDRIHFSNLKGNHTYKKTVCKKAKWGQNKFSKWSKTSSKLASKGPAIIIAPFPYIAGCAAACAST
ncbi:MAG: hypothetical protein LUB59_01800, partial [Candidatus Gastranaerophilales bacterium]|nr:hypothetical protein [Candidatus Gastranaerophilales bacterium]